MNACALCALANINSSCLKIDVDTRGQRRKYESIAKTVCLQVWINNSDIILIGLRDYQDQKADVILKYNAEEARNLKAYGELPDHGKMCYCLRP